MGRRPTDLGRLSSLSFGFPRATRSGGGCEASTGGMAPALDLLSFFDFLSLGFSFLSLESTADDVLPLSSLELGFTPLAEEDRGRGRRRRGGEEGEGKKGSGGGVEEEGRGRRKGEGQEGEWRKKGGGARRILEGRGKKGKGGGGEGQEGERRGRGGARRGEKEEGRGKKGRGGGGEGKTSTHQSNM